MLHWYFSKEGLPYRYILFLDCATVIASGYLSTYITSGGSGIISGFWPLTYGLVLCSVLFLIPFRLFHTYAGVMRFSSFADLMTIMMADFTGTVIVIAAWVIARMTGISAVIIPSPGIAVVMFFLCTMLMWLLRVLVKGFFDRFRADESTRRAFIFGVGPAAVALAKSIMSDSPLRYRLSGFVSTDGTLSHQYLLHKAVYQNDDSLIDNMKKQGASVMLVSPVQSDRFRESSELVDGLLREGIRIMMMPAVMEWNGTSPLHHSDLKDVDVEDLLPREKIEVDSEAIGAQLRGRRILITGAAGSIGSEIVRQTAEFSPSELVLIDQAETPMHYIRLMMVEKYPGIPCSTIVADITDAEYMESVFSSHRPEYVFHAAAYKHVPMMEDNPSVAVRNNVLGTRTVADLSVRYRAAKFVMISTDKAVNPTNVMGASKRICEIYCQSLNQAITEGKVKGVTQFVTTRFGNVLGSNGSVIPIFREQLRRGGPLTVTHREMVRFFMLIPEACMLVLQAATMGAGGEIFVFDMGKPVRIYDLASRMITLSGAKNVKIEITGLRDGEKLYEEVLSDKEKTLPTTNPIIRIAKVRQYDYETALRNEERLLEVSRGFDPMETVKVMKEIVPEFQSNHSVYMSLDQ